MRNFKILTESIEYIEANLREPITRGDVARRLNVSLSMLEKLFRYALSMSIGAYVTKRRMTQAAAELLKPGAGVTRAALRYQYHSAEVFSRAFKRVWDVSPSEFSRRWRFTGIFPKINYEYREGEEPSMAGKKVDLSEAYDSL